MTDALIGYSGFVGSHLHRAHEFGALFNSSNMAMSRGQGFELAVCAAAPASMWAANRDPEADERLIDRLIDQLSGFEARSFVLISTIAVLGDVAAGLDEDTENFEETLAYGRNRRMLERACRSLFDTCVIVRLPALFGTGLKKNFVFDILNPLPSFLTSERFAQTLSAASRVEKEAVKRVYCEDTASGTFVCDRAGSTSDDRDRVTSLLERLNFTAPYFTHRDSTFQYYGLDRLWADIERAREARLDLVHLAPEPTTAQEIHEAVTGRSFTADGAAERHEDMRTRHAAVFGARDGFTTPKAEVLAQLAAFARTERG